jgi:glycine betaine/proline transport system substrate-binding protein
MFRMSIPGTVMSAFIVGFGTLAACSSNSGGGTTTPTPAPSSTTPPVAESAVIKMAENDWLSAQLNNEVAQILLQEHLNIKVERIPATTAGQWDSLRSGDLHVSLEMWPSGHPDEMVRNQKDHLVEDAGPLGPVAKVGWFIPTYLLTAHPELATWEGYKDPANVALFQTVETGSKGRFMSGDPKWVAWDQQIIDNLGLNFQVTFAGSEEAELAELDSAYAKRAPLLFYLWIPHWIMAKYDLTMVTLPAYSDACWAKASSGGMDCDYPADHLTKIMWPGLKDLSPAGYQFLKAMNYTTKDQITMMASVKNKNLSVTDAARDWITNNESVWRTWLPAGTK